MVEHMFIRVQKCGLESCKFDVESKIMDVLPSYSSAVSDEPVWRPQVLKTIDDKIDELNPELRKISLKLHGRSNLLSYLRLPMIHLMLNYN